MIMVWGRAILISDEPWPDVKDKTFILVSKFEIIH